MADSDLIEAYPLSWPIGRPRARSRERAPFKVQLGTAIREVQGEVRRLGGTRLVISSNLPVRQDGMPYASATVINGDPGVAIYFQLRRGGKTQPMCFACDRWVHVRDNLRAIAKTIEALRGIERWGTGDMVEQAFTGFIALPAPAGSRWWEVLGVSAHATQDEINEAYRRLAMEAHPDRGGDTDRMARINKAREEGLGAAP